MPDLTGIELSAAALEHLGFELIGCHENGAWLYQRPGTSEYGNVVDFTATAEDDSWPHLGTVLKLARDRWPGDGVHLTIQGGVAYAAIGAADPPIAEASDPNPVTALLLAIVAAGKTDAAPDDGPSPTRLAVAQAVKEAEDA